MRAVRHGLGAIFGTTLCLVGAMTAADRRADVELRDDCDPATFNAVLGAGTCVGNGGTTFQEFQAELADKQEVGAWKNNPDDFHIVGGAISALNIGGEPHTFTEVAQFGGGFVAPLNDGSGNPIAAPECAQTATDGSLTPTAGAIATTARAGEVVSSGSLSIGTHRFQCCIHPWMRTEVTVRGR